MALSSEYMRDACTAGANWPLGAAPTRCVGESGVTSPGYSASMLSSSRTSESNAASVISGASKA